MIPPPLFLDRQDAGRKLAQALESYAHRDDVILLALPRGGVPVGHVIADQLGLPLDLMLVRKLGLPGNEELAMGAVAMGSTLILNRSVVAHCSLSQESVENVIARERAELDRRNALYRQGRTTPQVTGKTVILVDDGVATGADMRAAIHAVRQWGAPKVIVAVPAAPAEILLLLQQEADRVLCLSTPAPFFAVAQSYERFEQLTDEDVLDCMESVHATPEKKKIALKP